MLYGAYFEEWEVEIMAKRNIDGEKTNKPPTLPGREEFSEDYSTYGEKREALKELFRKSENQKRK